MLPGFLKTVTVSGGRGRPHCLSRDESRRAFKRLISGELTNYRVVRTSPDPLQKLIRVKLKPHHGTDVNIRDAAQMCATLIQVLIEVKNPSVPDVG
jgi:hypothetical protein